MNIYKISQRTNNEYDTFDSAVVYADNESEASEIHPRGASNWTENGWPTWANFPSEVKVELIGQTDTDVKPGVICASFNAG